MILWKSVFILSQEPLLVSIFLPLSKNLLKLLLQWERRLYLTTSCKSQTPPNIMFIIWNRSYLYLIFYMEQITICNNSERTFTCEDLIPVCVWKRFIFAYINFKNRIISLTYLNLQKCHLLHINIIQLPGHIAFYAGQCTIYNYTTVLVS